MTIAEASFIVREYMKIMGGTGGFRVLGDEITGWARLGKNKYEANFFTTGLHETTISYKLTETIQKVTKAMAKCRQQ